MIAGGSNVLIAVLAARLLDTALFGLFGLVFLVYAMVQQGARSLVSEPLLLHPQEARERTGEVLGAGATLGLGLGVIVAAAAAGAWAWDHRLAHALVVLAVCMPLMSMQDLGRYLAFATQRPANALILDLTWLGLQLGAVLALAISGTHSLTWFIAAWAGSGAAAGAWVFWQHRGSRLRRGRAWIATTWSYSWRYLLAGMAASGSAVSGSFLLGAISGPKALGALTGANLMTRPFTTLQIAAIASGVSEVAHDEQDRPTVLHHVRRTSTLTTAVALVMLVVLVTLPDALGRLVLGQTWEPAQPLLLPTGLLIVEMGLITGPRSGLLGLRKVGSAMVIDLGQAATLLTATVIGALVDGAVGVAWAVAIGQLWVTAAWWVTFNRHLAHLPSNQQGADPQ